VSTTGCLTAADVAAGHHQVSCAGGINYDIEVPAACPPGGCGLILDMHGFTMDAGSEDANTDMRARGGQAGYVVVQPTAPGFTPSWNQDEDAPFVFTFVADVANMAGTDPSRAHVMGFSQGGGMTWRMVCDHADFFASAAPGGAIEGCAFDAAHAPSEEVDVLVMHGHNDVIVSFQSTAIPQRDAALAYWAFGPPEVFAGDATYTATRWTTAQGSVLELWEHDYSSQSLLIQGHCFPGSDDTGFLGLACEPPNAFSYGEIALQFFLDHPKE
jgi:poly(3-hydroxybutyrate) depolymerase